MCEHDIKPIDFIMPTSLSATVKTRVGMGLCNMLLLEGCPKTWLAKSRAGSEDHIMGTICQEPPRTGFEMVKSAMSRMEIINGRWLRRT